MNEKTEKTKGYVYKVGYLNIFSEVEQFQAIKGFKMWSLGWGSSSGMGESSLKMRS